MVQTVCTYPISVGEKRIVLEKPHTLHRVFFSISVLSGGSLSSSGTISFDDPLFRSYYAVSGTWKHFVARGVDIFQGNIWAKNSTNADFFVTVTEILH